MGLDWARGGFPKGMADERGGSQMNAVRKCTVKDYK